MPSKPTSTPTVSPRANTMRIVMAKVRISCSERPHRQSSVILPADDESGKGFLLPEKTPMKFWKQSLGGFNVHHRCCYSIYAVCPFRFRANVTFNKEGLRSKFHAMAADRRPEFFKGAQLKVAIIGCGYVGLPLALRFAEAGHKVTGFDTDPKKVQMLSAGKSYIEHIQQTKIQQYVNSKHFTATTDFARLKEVDAILICVPTPLNEYREPDLSYVEQTAISIQPHLQKGQLVVLESTTYPGTTEELVLPILEKSGLRCPIDTGTRGKEVATDFYLAFSPEREDPGNKQFGLAQIPKIVGGVNPASAQAAAEMYTQIVSRVIPVSSTRAAEMVKLMENIFRCVNIAMVN